MSINATHSLNDDKTPSESEYQLPTHEQELLILNQELHHAKLIITSIVQENWKLQTKLFALNDKRRRPININISPTLILVTTLTIFAIKALAQSLQA